MAAGEAAREAFAESTPQDWKYIAEGALNVALRYSGENAALRGYVLRVRKDNKDAAGGEEMVEDPWDEAIRFVDKLVVPILGRRYVQPSIKVPLKQGFITALGEAVEQDRPEARRVHPFQHNLSTGLLMLDNTSIPDGTCNPTICIELKVKCGFRPEHCAFVTHQVKREISRFQLHQQLKVAKGKLQTCSKYDPLDLFAPDKARIQTALDALIETPQNNIRVFIDGKMVYPDTNGHGSRAAFQRALGQTVLEDNLLHALTEIVANEPLMDRIRTMQELDDLDIEGTYPSYQAVVARGDTIPPLAEGPVVLPRERPTSLPETPEEHHEAIRRFLLSCTAKDCSVMIALKPKKDGKAEGVSISGVERKAKASDDNLEGRTICSAHGFQYSIAIVDLDPKPHTKMPHYYELDKSIAEHYVELKSAGKLQT